VAYPSSEAISTSASAPGCVSGDPHRRRSMHKVSLERRARVARLDQDVTRLRTGAVVADPLERQAVDHALVAQLAVQRLDGRRPTCVCSASVRK
jgi:hypothetical protein